VSSPFPCSSFDDALSITLALSGHRVQERLPKIAHALGGVCNEAEIQSHCLTYVVGVVRADTMQGWLYGPCSFIVSIYSTSGVRRFDDSNDRRAEIFKFDLNPTTMVTHMRHCLKFSIWSKCGRPSLYVSPDPCLEPFSSNLDDL
jgi:hypothetical protein